VQLLLLDEIRASAELAEEGADSDPGLAESGKCECRFGRSYWLLCRHVIYAFEVLGEIEEPNWKELSQLFDESGFEIYTSQALVEVAEFSDSLDSDEKDRLRRWEEELADFSSAFIGRSLSERLNRKDEVILF
jgi:hypothetical protein